MTHPDDFRAGDRVRLRRYTNHPTMTVAEVYAAAFHYRYLCRWEAGSQLYSAEEIVLAERCDHPSESALARTS